MSSSKLRRGRPSQLLGAASPEHDQSTSSKKRKLNTNTSSATRPVGSSHSFVKRLISGGRNDAPSGIEENYEESNDASDRAADDLEEESAADESEHDEVNAVESEGKPARLTTKSSSATKSVALLPPARHRSGRSRDKTSIEGAKPFRAAQPAKIGNSHEAEESQKPKKLKRIVKYALRADKRRIQDGQDGQDSAAESKESSLDPLSGQNDRTNRPKHQSISQSSEVAEPMTAKPKSILAIEKRQRGRPKKNVGFEIGEAENLDLGFKDIPTKKRNGGTREYSSTKTRRRAPKKGKGWIKATLKHSVEEDSDSDGEEDVPCAICHTQGSEEPNEIVFCEGCNLAVHQECYGIPVVPEGDWFCEDCLPEEQEEENDEGDEVEEPIADGLALEPEDESKAIHGEKQGPHIENLKHHLQIMQSMVLQKLTGQRRMMLRGLDEEFKKVFQVVEQTILAGESNSMLVIGARGSGKTTLVENVLSDLSTEHRQDFHIVRLNGFIHTDDKLALHEIWRQLGREMDLDEELTGKTSNHADTLASLLALLSHPSELSETDPSQISKSVIFILDEFDLFATHSRQTLLYNLFDIAQARKAPIAVLGLTTRIDVVEALEKRVKSRFSHRYVHLSLPKSLPAFWDICKEGLIADEEQIEALDHEVDMRGWSEFQIYWNNMLVNLYTKDPSFKHHLQTHFYHTKSISSFHTTCLLPLATLTPSSLPLSGSSFSSSPTTSTPIPFTKLNLLPPDSKLHLIPTLPTLPLTLLICAARLDIIHDTETCNFAMAYDEYTTLATRYKIQNANSNNHTSSPFNVSVNVTMGTKIWGREVALAAWERLIECGILVGVGAGAGGEGKATRMWRVDIGLEEIGVCMEGMGEVIKKWCREI